MQNFLISIGYTPVTYLKDARKTAKKNGYDSKSIFISDDSVHKLMMHTPYGIKRFGRVGYGDFLIWKFLEKQQKVPKLTSIIKRNRFHKSHEALAEKYNITDKFAPNTLALNILW
jgi:hypothetical protein